MPDHISSARSHQFAALAQSLTTIINEHGAAQLTFPTRGQAVNFRHQFYTWRKYYAEGQIANGLILSLAKGSSTIIFSQIQSFNPEPASPATQNPLPDPQPASTEALAFEARVRASLEKKPYDDENYLKTIGWDKDDEPKDQSNNA